MPSLVSVQNCLKTVLVSLTVVFLVAIYRSPSPSQICRRFFDPLMMLGQMDVKSMTAQQLMEYLFWTNR